MPEIKVQKKDGRLEDFDRSKVHSGVSKSGTTPEEAEKIAAQIETWVRGAAVNGVIGTSAIRAKVLEILRSVNPTAATNFETYKKTV